MTNLAKEPACETCEGTGKTYHWVQCEWWTCPICGGTGKEKG